MITPAPIAGKDTTYYPGVSIKKNFMLLNPPEEHSQGVVSYKVTHILVQPVFAVFSNILQLLCS